MLFKRFLWKRVLHNLLVEDMTHFPVGKKALNFFTAGETKIFLARVTGFVLLVNGLLEAHFAIPNCVVIHYSLKQNPLLAITLLACLTVMGMVIGYCLLFKVFERFWMVSFPVFVSLKFAAYLLGFPESGMVQLLEQLSTTSIPTRAIEFFFQIIIGASLLATVYPLKSSSANSGRVIMSKRWIYFTPLVSLLLLGAAVYATDKRLESALTNGLIDISESPVVRRRLEALPMQIGIKREIGRPFLMLLLKGEACASCVMEMLMWNATPYPKKIEIAALFPTDDLTREKLSKATTLDPLRLKFRVHYLHRELYSEIAGSGPRLAARLLFDSKGQLVVVVKDEVGNDRALATLIKSIDSLTIHISSR